MPTIQTSIDSTKSARERILLTAHKLFYRDGIRATGVDRLIADSKVTKTTFYRHFPSKNDLIREFLKYRHQRWRTWFIHRLEHHGNDWEAICPALAEWFQSDDFRGCAFINSLGELGVVLPEIVEITARHKQDMTDIIENILPQSDQQKQNAQAIALAVDGAIIRAQFDRSSGSALAILQDIIGSLLGNKKLAGLACRRFQV